MLKSVLKLFDGKNKNKDERVIECPECGRRCLMNGEATHMASVHGSQAVIHCTECEKENNHEYTGSGEQISGR